MLLEMAAFCFWQGALYADVFAIPMLMPFRRPSRPSFASPSADAMDDFPDDMPSVDGESSSAVTETTGGSPEKSNDTAKAKPKKKKKVVQTFTEEELEEIENAPGP